MIVDGLVCRYVTAVASPTRYTVQLDEGFPSLNMPHFKESTAWVVIKDKVRINTST